jgi:GT2 family glycosyltransferase
VILIIARNNLYLTKKAVASARKAHNCEVLLTDNASEDNTPNWLNAQSTDGFRYQINSTQQSLAACWNAGLSFIFKNQDKALVINNDVEILPDTYKILSEYPGEFVTGVSVRTPEELVMPDTFTASPHPDFSCFCISRNCFETVGPFDEAMFPAYAEDSDYHVRMHRAGIKAVSLNLPFLHHGSQTIKQCSEAERHIIQRGADANRERFFKKYKARIGTPEYDKLFV